MGKNSGGRLNAHGPATPAYLDGCPALTLTFFPGIRGITSLIQYGPFCSVQHSFFSRAFFSLAYMDTPLLIQHHREIRRKETMEARNLDL